MKRLGRLSAACLAAAVLAGQTPQEGLVTFKTTTQMVIVNVVAKARSGKAIEDLKAEDFTILEDGQPQKIAVCDYQRVNADAPPPAPPRAPAAAPAIAASAPGEVRYKDRRLLVMYFDLGSMPPAEMWRTQSAALKFIREQMQGSDLVAVMTYARQLEIRQDFTADRDRLAQVVGALQPEADDAEAADDDAADEFNLFNTDQRLGALERAVRILGGLAERKALVYFAAGSGGTGAENQSQLRSTINAAQRSNVVFYSVDARGLTAQAPMGNATSASPGGAGIYSGDAARQTAIQLGGEDETLYRLAKETGGKALVDTNDLSAGLTQAQKDLSSYYILGYYSANTAQDGKYRRIKVQLNRRIAGVTLDYRAGHFAPREFKALTATDRERQLEDALLLGNPVTDLRLALEIDYFRVERGRYVVPLAVKIPGAEIELPKDGAPARLDVIGQVRNAQGVVATGVRDTIQVNTAGDAGGQLASRTVQYETAFLLPPGSYTLKVLARENETGKMGTFETPFSVPDLSTEVDYLPISSVVLSNRREKVPGGDRGKIRNPLLQAGEKLVPSVTRVFRKGGELYLYLEAYEPLAKKMPPVTVRVSFYRGNVKAFESESLRIADAFDDAAKALPVTLSVGLDRLQPGRYTCQVSVLAPAAEKFAFWRAPIVVVP